MSELSVVQLIAIWVVPVLLAITVHETAHGWVAAKLGDTTAYMLGRLTLNPLKHIDPFGTILLPAMMIMLAGFALGYAKPVPVNWSNLRHPKRDMAIVAAAGPFVNLLMAVGWALLIRLGLTLGESAEALVYMGVGGIFINVILMVINMLPLPPLDGGRVAVGLLPGPWAYQLSRIEPWGFFILIALLFTGMLGWLLWPLIEFCISVLSSVSGLQAHQFMLKLNALMGR
ncbi:MAG: site-2 protease family protein [Gammaproteobacteria bacterium]|nr:site-2 protease family protein [Gammaproteobacteria bacterium]NNJ93320.1 site-2 protease family protein [Halobacteria archaeon]